MNHQGRYDSFLSNTSKASSRSENGSAADLLGERVVFNDERLDAPLMRPTERSEKLSSVRLSGSSHRGIGSRGVGGGGSGVVGGGFGVGAGVGTGGGGGAGGAWKGTRWSFAASDLQTGLAGTPVYIAPEILRLSKANEVRDGVRPCVRRETC